jgi:hypothetical protein
MPNLHSLMRALLDAAQHTNSVRQYGCAQGWILAGMPMTCYAMLWVCLSQSYHNTAGHSYYGMCLQSTCRLAG